MIKIENTQVFNFEGAIRGMRNPLNSWDKSDSVFSENPEDFVIGENDISLMKKLIKSGSEHRKFMRQIFVCADFSAPLYWWKEADQYRIGCTTDSCSTMHTIHKKEFELDDFSHEHLYIDRLSPYCPEVMLQKQIEALNFWRRRYLETKSKSDWWQIIQLLPSSYNQKRTWTGSYENLFNMYHQRKNHKLDEWQNFCKWIKTLPYSEELIEGDENGSNEQA